MTGNWTSKVRCLPFFLSAARQERSDTALLVLPPATPVAGVQALGIWDRSLRALILPQGRAAANVAKSYGRPAGREVRRGRPLPVALIHPSPVLRPSRAPPDLCSVLSRLTQGTVSGNKRPLLTCLVAQEVLVEA